MSEGNIHIKRDYRPPKSQYVRMTLVVRVLAGAAFEPPALLERRGRDAWRKIRDEVDRRLPDNKARFTSFAAIRRNTFFMELELDGKTDHVDAYFLALSEVVDAAQALTDALTPSASTTDGQLLLPSPTLRATDNLIGSSLKRIPAPKEPEPVLAEAITFTIRDDA